MKKQKLKRTHKISIALNDKEYQVFMKYIKKYKVKNKAEFLRRVIFTHILKQFDNDYPTVFDQER